MFDYTIEANSVAEEIRALEVEPIRRLADENWSAEEWADYRERLMEQAKRAAAVIENVIESCDDSIAIAESAVREEMVELQDELRFAEREAERYELILHDARNVLGLSGSIGGFVEACKGIRKRLDKLAEIVGMG
ncbi:MAG: hypothetical protein AAGE52_35180 [Myxococcota bacterium]